MATGRACWIECDECGGQVPTDLGQTTIAAARDEARITGWRRRKGRDVCPHCLETTDSAVQA